MRSRSRRARGRQGSAIKASTEVEAEEAGEVKGPRIGHAGDIYDSGARRSSLADGAEIVGNTALPGNGGGIDIEVDDLESRQRADRERVDGHRRGCGRAGAIDVDAATSPSSAGRISATTLDGAGGTIELRADDPTRRRRSVGRIDGSGAGGDVVLSANTISATGGATSASSTGAATRAPRRDRASDALTLDSGRCVRAPRTRPAATS